MADIALLYTTWPDDETARAAGRRLVDERLAACMNLLGPITSIYRWQGAIEEAREVAALFKTTAGCAGAAAARIAELHPYATPAIVALRVDAAGTHAPFSAWVAAETGEAG